MRAFEDDGGQDRFEARQDRLQNQQPAPAAPAVPPPPPDGGVPPEEDPGADEQQSGGDMLDDQGAQSDGQEAPGAPARPRRSPKANTPLGIAGTFAQLGSAAAAPFRSENFFTNRMIGSTGGGGQQPMRFGAGSGSSLGGAFNAQIGSGEANRRPGLSPDELMQAIQMSQGGMVPFGG